MALIALMVVVGGVTRLTESGLSIVEWKLLSGTLPPLSDESWHREFEAYKTSPEYLKVNTGMDVDAFKRIFWLEYLHRLLGRIIGMALIIPTLLYMVRKKMDRPLAKRMMFACLLVAAQGAVGWLMVKSGLVDDPRVSPVRLALHLCLAFALFSLLFWTRLQLKGSTRNHRSTPKQACAIRVTTTMVAIQIMFGAFVAGTRAGLSYNTFPLMDGQWIPDGLAFHTPFVRNIVDNITMIQFQHRMMAYIASLMVIGFVWSSWQRCDTPQRRMLLWLIAALLLQFSLGVSTLLNGVPIALASAHQLGALLLLSSCIRVCYSMPINTLRQHDTHKMAVN